MRTALARGPGIVCPAAGWLRAFTRALKNKFEEAKNASKETAQKSGSLLIKRHAPSDAQHDILAGIPASMRRPESLRHTPRSWRRQGKAAPPFHRLEGGLSHRKCIKQNTMRTGCKCTMEVWHWEKCSVLCEEWQDSSAE